MSEVAIVRKRDAKTDPPEHEWDDGALLKEAADEIERLQARVQELEAAHDKNIRKAYSTRRLVGKGHHCMWREAAEAMEQRARAALAAVSAETEEV